MSKLQELKVSILADGIIDQEEAEWLLSKIVGDGQLNEIEKTLLNNLKKKSKNFPSSLNLK